MKTLVSTLLGLLLPNLLFAMVVGAFGLSRPWVNLDYLLIAVLFAFRRSVLAGCLLAWALLADCLMLVGQVFPLLRIGDLFYILGFSLQASGFHLLLLCGALLTLALTVLALAQLARFGQRLAVLLVLNASLLLFAAQALFAPVADGRFFRPHSQPLGSQTLTWVRSREDALLAMFEVEGSPFSGRVQGASEPWLIQQQRAPRMLLMVLESWGLPRQKEIQAALLAPLQAVSTQLRQGHEPFVGVTVGGELRELCGLVPRSFDLRGVSREFADCLPNRLRQEGYATASLHAASGTMYDRRSWYPSLGFERMAFFENHRWTRRCYSFPGGCDQELLGDVVDFFAQPGKRFLYWLTLNSHPPYDLRDLHAPATFDCAHYAVAPDSESCRNLQLQAQFFEDFAAALRRPEMAGVEVIMVGDHTPVILDLEEKRRYFVEDTVPWVHFVVR